MPFFISNNLLQQTYCVLIERGVLHITAVVSNSPFLNPDVGPEHKYLACECDKEAKYCSGGLKKKPKA